MGWCTCAVTGKFSFINRLDKIKLATAYAKADISRVSLHQTERLTLENPTPFWIHSDEC